MNNSPEQLKKEFLLNPDITFLNHGSFGATPRPVFEEYRRWQRELEYQPVEFLGRRVNDLLADSRAVLADYLKTARDNLVYVTNATTGLNIVARSLNLGKDDDVLTSDHEYGALDRTWQFLSLKCGFKYVNTVLKTPFTTEDDFVEDLWKGVNAHTKVIFISQITSPTAIVFPVKKICQRARQQNILTVVDGAHAPGQVPVELDDMGADFYSGNLHKWVCAPKGAAFLYARPEVQHMVEPLVVSWGWHSAAPSASTFIDEQEWTGTRDVSCWLTVPAAIQYQDTHHWDQVRARCHQLTSETQKRITRLTGIQPLHPDELTWFSQMGASPLPDAVDVPSLKIRLYDEFKVEIPLIEWNGRKLIRFSFQGYNSEADVDRLLFALEKTLS